MTQLTGKAVIRRKGVEMRTLDGASLDPGGEEREAVKGYKVYGHTSKPKQPELECKFAHDKDMDLIELSGDTDVTIIFETDTGDAYILNNAWASAPAKLEGNEVSIKYEAIRSERR